MILPFTFGRFTWITLINNGGVAGGQNEEKTMISEFLTEPPPFLIPDTPAGKKYSEDLEQENKQQYFLRPQNCRLNFLKLGVSQPFSIDWLKLFQTWVNDCKDFFVLREPDILNRLAHLTCKVLAKNESSSEPQICTDNVANVVDLVPKTALVRVHLILQGKGNIEDLAMICLPTHKDIENSFKSLHLCSIIEPSHTDLNATTRKEMKIKHKSNLVSKKSRANVNNSNIFYFLLILAVFCACCDLLCMKNSDFKQV